MPLKNLDLDRAKYALDCIDEAKHHAEKYKTAVMKALPMIINNGFVATVAFIAARRAKDDNAQNEQDLLYMQLNEWLRKKRKLFGEAPEPDFLRLLLKSDSRTIMLATKESVAFLGWLKRMAEAKKI